ncbi:MAG: DNA translocase FtsK [Anaerolineae bacterium]
MGRSSGPSTYGAPSSGGTAKSPSQSGKSSAKGNAAKGGLLATLSFGRLGGKKDSKPARTPRQGATVEVKPVSFARDKQFEIAGLILTISGIVLLLSSLSPVQGSIPQQVNGFLSSLFGWGSIFVPIAMIPIGIWLILIKVGQNAPVIALSRILGIALLFVSGLVLMQFIDALNYPPGQGQTYDQYLAALQNVLLPLSSEFGRGGGRIGGTLYYQLIRNFSEPGGFVILLGVLIVGLMLALSVSAYEIAAIVIGSTRNLRDARRRRSTRIAAERTAAQATAAQALPGAPVETSPALAAPATVKSAALPAATAGTQPLTLEAPAQDRSIPILMGGRPLSATTETEAAALKPVGVSVPFPPLSPVPKPGEPTPKPADSASPASAAGPGSKTEDKTSESEVKPTSVFGRFKSALPAVGAATVLAAKSTVNAITPDKETDETDSADDEAKKTSTFGKFFTRGTGTATTSDPISAAAAKAEASPATDAKPSATGSLKPGGPIAATTPTSAASTTDAAKSAPVRFPLPTPALADDEDDDLDVFDDEEFEDEEDDEATAPPRLGDLLRPSSDTAKPAATASTFSSSAPGASPASSSDTAVPSPTARPATSSPSGVTPFSRPPLSTSVSAAPLPVNPADRTQPAAEKSAGPAPTADPGAESTTTAPAETAPAASVTPAAAKPVASPSPIRPPLKSAMPLEDDDWSHLPPARAKSTAEPRSGSTTSAAAAMSVTPTSPPGPAVQEKRASRPWENNAHDDAPPPTTQTPASKPAEPGPEKSSNGVSGAVKTGTAAVLGGMAAAASSVFRSEPDAPKATDAPRPVAAAAPAPFSRTVTSSPAQPTPVSTPVSAPPPRASSGRPSWRLPDFTGLLATGGDQEMNHDKLLARARTIEDTLASFGAPGRVVEVRTGPVITQFGVEPDYVEVRGKKNRVKVSAIANLDKDLQLSLGAKSIRIEAPVPGKGYVGIEVPNDKPSMVRLRDVMESNEFRRISSPLAIALGQGVDGTPVAADLGSMPHLLIAGTTGSGKSVAVNTIIASLLLRNSPDRLKFIMVDPKRVELTGYNGIPHLVAPVVVELERVVSVLKWVTREMDERYRKYALAGARNIEDFNNHLPVNEPPMPYIVVIIDELADLMMMAPDDTEKVITRIAALARATGIHLVIATQRPSVDVVTGLIKANFPARIAFAVSAGVDSRVILDQPGAEKLLGKGDMLFMSGDTPAPARLQGVYVSDTEIGNITRFWRNQMAEPGLAEAGKPVLSDFKLDEATKSSSPPARGSGIGYGNGGRPSSGSSSALSRFDEDEIEDDEDANDDNDDDVLYEQAVETVRRLNKASVSLLQRRLRIGYTRAARLVDMMEERGVVGPAVEGSKPRDVLPIDKNKPI